MTATLRASKKRWIDADSARCSRARITLSEVSVRSMGNTSCMTPSSNPPTTL